MNVVGHEAISHDLETVLLAVLAQAFEVEFPVAVGKENILAVVAALRDVMRRFRHYDSGHACHDRILPSPDPIIKK